MNNKCICIENVSKCFGSKKILNNINVDIMKGEIFGLLGPSGAGKTTLIKIITGQIRATSGNVEVQGINTTKFEKETYSNFGMVLDNTGLYRRMSSYDNLRIFADIYNINKNKIDEVLEKVGLLDARKTVVEKLSKGMKQRLIIARALLHDPSILFLDEPTTGLDPATFRAIHKLILDEKKRGKTIFLTTHNMVEATKLCTNVALLNNGDIVEYGSPEEICRKYNRKNEVVILTKSNEQFCFENSIMNADRIADCFRNDNVLSIHSTEPTLESVFMELTGRKIDIDEY